MHAKTDINPNDTPREHYCTVGRLKEFFKEHNLPDDAKVFIQRVEDVYFEKYNWGTIKKEGCMYVMEKELIDKMKQGEYDDREKYPNMTDEYKQNIIDSESSLDDCKEEYVMVFSPVKYNGDENLYLDAHY